MNTTNNTQRTKGEWYVIDGQYPLGTISINTSTSCRIATIKKAETGWADEAEANAKAICTAVNQFPYMVKALKAAYLALQIEANASISCAIRTDSIRATLRNSIAQATGENYQQIQEENEAAALTQAKQ